MVYLQSSSIPKASGNYLSLETLKQEYRGLLVKYTAASNEYFAFINNNKTDDAQIGSINSSSKYFDFSYNRMTKTINNGNNYTFQGNDKSDCYKDCSDNYCTGATYNENGTNKTCYMFNTYPPQSDISSNYYSSGNSSDYAIIPSVDGLLRNMKYINDLLIKKNKEITDYNYTDISGNYYTIRSDISYNNYTPDLFDVNDLSYIKNYQTLLYNRDQIAELLNDYETANDSLNENQLLVTIHYYSYILLVILAVVSFIILYALSFSSKSDLKSGGNLQFGGNLGISNHYIVFGLFLIIILIIIMYFMYLFYHSHSRAFFKLFININI